MLGLLPAGNQGLFGLGLWLSLWGASMAIGALITTINRAYNIRPRRNLLKQKVLSIWLTLVLAVLWLLAFVIVLVGPRVTQSVFELLGIASETNTFWTSVRLPMAFGLTLVSLSILYYIAPEAKQRFRWILPGAVTATVLWMGASSGFRVFLRNFNNYDLTYGSLAGLVILMIWFWLSGLVFLLGAEINSLMKRIDEEAAPRARSGRCADRFPSRPAGAGRKWHRAWRRSDITSTWTGGRQFVHRSATGHALVTDTPVDSGGGNTRADADGTGDDGPGRLHRRGHRQHPGGDAPAAARPGGHGRRTSAPTTTRGSSPASRCATGCRATWTRPGWSAPWPCRWTSTARCRRCWPGASTITHEVEILP